MTGATNIIWRQNIDTGLAALLDPAPITFTPQNEKGVRPVRRVLSPSIRPRLPSLSPPLSRCCDFGSG